MRIRRSNGVRAPSLSSPSGDSTRKKSRRSRRRRRGKGRDRRRRAGARRFQTKMERKARNNLRIVYWNCGSLSVRPRAAEMLAYEADILCIQETQKAEVKPLDFHSPVKNDVGHGQLILVRKSISYRELDVSRWSSRNLHLVAIELSDQSIRNVVNVYACCTTMKEQDWLVLDDLQKTLPGETVLCGDFNARGALWGNTVVNPQGEALEDALDRCYLRCINDESITRMATRQGDSDSIIDLAITTLAVAEQCDFKVLDPQGNDHLPCLVQARRSKVTHQPRRKKAFKYGKEGEDVISRLRTRKTDEKPQQQKSKRRVQPPWFNEEVKRLWETKRAACKQMQRHKEDVQLRAAAREAAMAFEKAANQEKEDIYEEFSLTVTQDRSLHKFWQLHKAMNCAKKHKEIPDFRTEDDVWVRTSEEKGTALLERFLRQTDQGNEAERVALMHDSQGLYEDELMIPHTPIKADVLKRVITTSTDSAPGPDGVKYTDLKNLSDDDLQSLTNMLNNSYANQDIPDEWLDSHLAPVPKPDKGHTSIEGYSIVAM